MRHACLLLLLTHALFAEEPPAGLEHWLTGDPQDVQVELGEPAVILMGGGKDVDAAFRWWIPQIKGGDVVVLRASGADGYNRYLHQEIGGCDSVETLKVTTREQANSRWVEQRVAQAEAVWIAGGAQSRYVKVWGGTRLQRAVQAALKRGAVVGGTSAGCAVLGGVVFSAEHGTIRSKAALADPFARRVTLEPAMFAFAPLKGVLTDTHFSQRERLGRLVAFVARAQGARSGRVLGLGVDERTAVAIDAKGRAEVLGRNEVVLVRVRKGRAREGQPLSCRAEVTRLKPGDRFELPAGDEHPRQAVEYRAADGALEAIAR